MKKIGLINVGANASHGSLRSPLFPNGQFDFIPIPDLCLHYDERGVKYRQLRAYNGVDIVEFLHEKYHQMCAHYDPEFETFTYGDYPTYHPRAANLGKLSKGDYIFFFSRLVLWRNQGFTREAKFYLIGFIEIERIFKDITRRPSHRVFRKIRNNAHIIRGECNPMFYDSFWVFKGSERSRRFRHAIPFDREFIEGCGILDASNEKWKWYKFRSELSAIGSYLRSSKLIHEEEQLKMFWKRIHNQLNEDTHGIL